MFILALDTATAVVTAGIVRLGATQPPLTLATGLTRDAHKHGEALAPHIRKCLQEIGITPAEIGAVVVGAGPGPFTGLRVGMATGAVFASTTDVPLYTVCTLDAIAHDAALRLSEPFLVATDARRKEVYWAAYSALGVRVAGPGVAQPALLRSWLDGERPQLPSGQAPVGLEEPCSLPPLNQSVGAGAVLYALTLGFPAPLEVDPSAGGLVAVAASRIHAQAPSDALTPLYLRRPDAVASTPTKSVLP